MKKQLLTIVAAGAVGSLFAQLPVSTTPSNKNAVLEEYTGIYCGYCPDGHKIGTNIYNADPTHVVLINIHTGGYANVAAGEPDLTTTEGTAIAGMPGMGITGYPAGDMNRTVLSGTAMAGSRSLWTGWKTTITGQSAYCNVALQGTINVQTRVLTVQAAVYYTANSPVSSNSLNIVLMESDISGPQHDYGNYNPTNWNPDGTYKHNHVLRKAITGNFGITIPVTTSGTTFTTTQTYTIPATYGAVNKTTQALFGRMEIAAFVTETNAKTINAAHGPLTLSNFPNTLDIGSPNLTTVDGKMTSDAMVCAAKLNAGFKFVNYGSTPVTSAVFSYNVNGGAPLNYTWTSSTPLQPYAQSQTINLPVINFVPVANNTLNINVASVNGSADQNAANNSYSKVVPLTTVTANTLAMQMDFTQDQWGSEDKWTVYDESTMSVISTDGPWTDLASAGTVLHTKTFTVSPSACYKLVVTDAYGDGTYNSTPANCGSYYLKSGSTNLIWNANGNYGYGENKWYKSAASTGIAAPQMNIWGVSVYPNPASNAANINIEMAQNENLNVAVMNALGQVVYTDALSLEAGVNTVKLNTENWTSGLYSINITSAKGSTTHKLTISK